MLNENKYKIVFTKSGQFNNDLELSCFPEKYEEHTIYYWEEGGLVSYICPCSCKRNVFLKVRKFKEPETHPSWELNVATVTFSPSIYSKYTCGAHYFIQDGIVKWA